MLLLLLLLIVLYCCCCCRRCSLQPHRVMIPEDESERLKVRRSLAFFAQPDPDVTITCVDGSNKYPPVTSVQYHDEKLQTTHIRRPIETETSSHESTYTYSVQNVGQWIRAIYVNVISLFCIVNFLRRIWSEPPFPDVPLLLTSVYSEPGQSTPEPADRGTTRG